MKINNVFSSFGTNFVNTAASSTTAYARISDVAITNIQGTALYIKSGDTAPGYTDIRRVTVTGYIATARAIYLYGVRTFYRCFFCHV